MLLHLAWEAVVAWQNGVLVFVALGSSALFCADIRCFCHSGRSSSTQKLFVTNFRCAHKQLPTFAFETKRAGAHGAVGCRFVGAVALRGLGVSRTLLLCVCGTRHCGSREWHKETDMLDYNPM